MGLSDKDIARQVRQGELHRLRRGDYVRLGQGVERPVYEAEHELQARATMKRMHSGALSHQSAAVWWGLPLPPGPVGRVHVTKHGRGGGSIRTFVQVHKAPLEKSETIERDGQLVTTLERTAVDLARVLTPDRAVAVVDAALRKGADLQLMRDMVDERPKADGTPRARAALDFGDRLAESPGESRSRWFMAQHGLPKPVLQHEVFDSRGLLVGRCDFAWLEWGVAGEFDGWVKYGRLLLPGQSVEDVLRKEKAREQALQREGFLVARWTDEELKTPALWAEGLRASLEAARSGPRRG